MTRRKKENKKLPLYFLILVVLLLSGIVYLNLERMGILNQKISVLENIKGELENVVSEKNVTIHEQIDTISTLEVNVEKKDEKIKDDENKINSLGLKVNSLGEQLGQTQIELGQTEGELVETTRLLDVAKDYEERVEQGIDISKAYILLGDYDQTINIVSGIDGINGISTPPNDQELWSRGKIIYDWLGAEYLYCSDKGFCIGDFCPQIQFFSPDELLYYGAQDVLCGDCDDKAQLFAGMMYASGVPHDMVRVECGFVPPGGHCWNGIYIEENWILIDPTCSDPTNLYLEQFEGIELTAANYPLDGYRHVSCFDTYNRISWYNPEGYHGI